MENGLAANWIAVLSGIDEDSYYDLSGYSNEEIEYKCELSNLMADGHGFKTALESFHLSKETIGEIIDVTDYKAEKRDGSLVVSAVAKGSKNKYANVELIFTDDLFCTLKGGSLNPISTTGELMQKAALNTVIGMGTVFAVLILISIIIACFGLIPKIQAAFAKKEKKTNTTGIENAVAQITKQEAVLEAADDTELVAVIAAAVAAYEGSANTDGFVVRSIRRR
ncbi:MAG: OadG family protein [Lachnospiraceae bacterium]|nr:OadG family protein [Lachnospiraceae bacterium]